MVTQDLMTEAARSLFLSSANEIENILRGLDSAGLTWRPTETDSNSISVLAEHALGSTQDKLCIAFDAPPPPRSRDDEFMQAFDSEEHAIARLYQVRANVMNALDDAPELDWEDLLPDDPADEQAEIMTRAKLVIYALVHMREHVGQMLLTRQLWEQSQK